MYIAKSNNKLINALDADASSVFICPACNQSVYLKHGELKMPHFAHFANSECDSFSENESFQHLSAKISIFEYLQKFDYFFNIRMEAVLGSIKQRPDILFNYKSLRIAIEIQLSPISFKRLMERNEGYKKEGIIVFWLLGDRYKKISNLNINKFQDDKNQIYIFHSSDEIQINSNFLNINFQKIKFSSTLTSLNRLIKNEYKTNSFKLPIIDIDKQRRIIERRLYESRIDPEIVNTVYKTFQKSIKQAPDFVFLGYQYQFTKPDWQVRLLFLIFLDENKIFTIEQVINYLDKENIFYPNVNKKLIIKELLNSSNIENRGRFYRLKNQFEWL